MKKIRIAKRSTYKGSKIVTSGRGTIYKKVINRCEKCNNQVKKIRVKIKGKKLKILGCPICKTITQGNPTSVRI